MSAQVYTSTPKQKDDPETTALREKKWQNIIEKTKTDGRRKKLASSKKRYESKENFRRERVRKNQRKYHENNFLAEKRRKQAIESMKIAEQRRIRKKVENEDPDKLAEDFGKMNLNGDNELLPDGRIKLTKKQLIARDLKQNRIRKYYEGQQSRKKKSVSFCYPIASNERQYRAPRKFTSTPTKAPKPQKVEEAAKKEDENVQTCQNLIRYTKQELLELCPYGVYFFR